MKDALSGKTRTWPYGTEKRVEIITHETPDHPMSFPVVIARDNENNEGFLLIGDKGADESKVGDLGHITFTKGGPLGGYWKFTKSTTT